MRIINLDLRYQTKIYVLDDMKSIYKVDCTCPDFVNRRMRSVGDFADKKYYALPCKHLRPFVERLIKQGYILKIPQEMLGPDKLTVGVKRKVIERSGEICEVETCIEKAIVFHRNIRGSNGGKYTLENTRHLCSNHHKLIHSNEFSGSKSK